MVTAPTVFGLPMIKMILSGVWVAALLVGSTMFFAPSESETHEGKNEGEKGAYFGALDYIKIDPMSISLVRDNAVRGYLLLNAAYTIDGKAAATITVPLDFVMKDVIITSVHQSETLDVFKLSSFDTIKFQDQLERDINKKLGKKIVHEVLILKLEFISIEDVRDMQMRRS